jgi:tetratricopeptide (TPR) repeat protein
MRGWLHNKAKCLGLLALLVDFPALSGKPLIRGQAPTNAQHLRNRQFQSAVSLYEAQKYDQARELLLKLLRQSPNDFEVNELMGLVWAAQGQNQRAGAYLAKAVHLQPESAEARMYLATNLLALGHSHEAEIEFKKAVALDPGNFETNHNLGEFYIQAGDLPAAIPYLHKAAQIDPTAYNNSYDLALAEIKTGHYTRAQKTLKQALRHHNEADLHSLLALTNEKTGQYLQAANEYQLAAHLDPSETHIFDWGNELLLHHTLEPAVLVFRQGVKLYPQSARLEIGLGIALYSRTHYQQAIDAFCRAIDLNPADARPYVFLGKAYDISPVQAQAVTERFARFVQMQPHNSQALYYYALCLWKGFRNQANPADLPKIKTLLMRSVAIDPAFADARLQLGILDAQLHQYPDAIEQYRQAIKLQPSLADAHYRLAEALVRSGKKDEAQKEFQIFSKLHQQQMAESEKQRREIMEFMLTSEDGNHTPQ